MIHKPRFFNDEIRKYSKCVITWAHGEVYAIVVDTPGIITLNDLHNRYREYLSDRLMKWWRDDRRNNFPPSNDEMFLDFLHHLGITEIKFILKETDGEMNDI